MADHFHFQHRVERWIRQKRVVVNFLGGMGVFVTNSYVLYQKTSSVKGIKNNERI